MHIRIPIIRPILALTLLGLAAPACDDVELPTAKAASADAPRPARPDADDADDDARRPAPPPTTVDAALEGYSSCHARCHEEERGTDLSTCTLNCGVAAEAAYHTVEPTPDKAAYDAALGELKACVSSCDADTSRDTNMYTCYLNCKTSAQVDFSS